MEQKFVTLFLHDNCDGKKTDYGDPQGNKLFGVTEHLEEYFKKGWRVKDFNSFGGAGGRLSGWVVVLLEK